MVCNLIADAGSTKIQWALIDVADGHVKPFRTVGVNAVTASNREVENALSELTEKCPDDTEIASVQYYGAGCATEEICRKMESTIRHCTGCRHVEVHSDLEGAAKSLLGSARGVACILGTGSNSCLYDGHKIISNTPSLGYVIGDEGSGNAIGRRLLSDYFKKRMPENIAHRFSLHPASDLTTALHKVYREPGANRWLASLAGFAAENIDDDYIRATVKDEFHRFIERNVEPYSMTANLHDLPLCFTGGVASGFADILEEVCSEHGLNLERITHEPLEGLVKEWLKANQI